MVRSANFFRRQYGQSPGAFLAFRLLPGIARAKYSWLHRFAWVSGVVVDHIRKCGRTRTLIFVDHRRVNVFIRMLIFTITVRDNSEILTAKITRSKCIHLQDTLP